VGFLFFESQISQQTSYSSGRPQHQEAPKITHLGGGVALVQPSTHQGGGFTVQTITHQGGGVALVQPSTHQGGGFTVVQTITHQGGGVTLVQPITHQGGGVTVV